MNTLLQDVRGGVRLFVKYRWLTALAVLMLAVGIGSNAAIFSVANAVLFRPVAISDPGDVMVLWERDAEQPVLEVSYANFLDWRSRNTTFSNMAAIELDELVVRAADRWRPGRSPLCGRVRLVLRYPRRESRAGTNLRGRRRATDRDADRRHQSRTVAAAIRQLARRHRPST